MTRRLPDPVLTPGDITAATADVICLRGYAPAHRNVTFTTKVRIYLRYHLTPYSHRYRIDHLIPLEIGGANTVANLWSQRTADSHLKDGLEAHLRTEVCHGRMALADAQHAIATNWYAAYRAMKG